MKRYQSQVADWMQAEPATIASDASLADAYDLMQERGVRRLPVMDRQTFRGIITLSDILRALPLAADEGDRETRLMMTTRQVSDVMTYDPVTVQSEDTLQDAAERMLEYQVSGLPVLDGRRLVGIITESDIFRLVVETLAEELDSDLDMEIDEDYDEEFDEL
jgi:acetoin utilization protein AcuB